MLHYTNISKQQHCCINVLTKGIVINIYILILKIEKNTILMIILQIVLW